MAYASGDDIEAQHYNTFVWGTTSGGTLTTSPNNINLLWGPGFGQQGLNQDMGSVIGLPNNQGIVTGEYNDTIGTLTPVDGVSAGDFAVNASTVRSQQWIGLISAMNRALYHQQQGNVNLSQSPGFGRDIRFISAMNSYLTQIANSMGAARFTAVRPLAGGPVNTAWSQAASSTEYTLTITRTVEWPDADDARWFFNAGGKIKVGISGTGAGNDRSTAVAIVLNAMGVSDIGFNSRTQFTGDDLIGSANKGYWNVSTSAYEIIGRNNAESGSTYSATTVSCGLQLAGDAGSNGGRGKRLLIQWNITSGFGGSGGEAVWAAGDALSLTVGTTVDVVDPSYAGGMLQRTWADPTIG
jgi:hypothetical protein